MNGNNKLLSLGIGFLLSHFSLLAQLDYKSARAAGMGGISILSEEVFSTLNNPSISLPNQSFGVGLLYENHSLLKELAEKTFVLNKGFKNSVFGFAINQVGFSAYQELNSSLSYGMRLSEGFSMGIKVNYFSLELSEYYGRKSLITTSIGASYHLSEKVQMAIVLINPEQRKLADFDNERLASLLKLGLLFPVSEKVMLLSEFSKGVASNPSTSIGLEYLCNSQFYFRFGYASLNSISCLGFSINSPHYYIDLAFQYQAYFGLSPQISLSYVLESSDEK